MTAPLVSVCMPCYNAAPFVGAALDSVLAQTWNAVEIIAVNDGSTDATGDVLEHYRARGVRVVHQQNQGQSAAANRALAEARGALIKFLDADDLLAPDMIARQVARLGGRRDAVVMGEWARFRTDPAEAVFAPLPMYRDAVPVEWLVSEWSTGEAMMQCALYLIPAEILARSGGWDPALSLINDFEFFTRVLLSAQELLYSPQARLYYRSGLSESLSARRSDTAIVSAWRSITLASQHLLRHEDSVRTRRACADVCQGFEYFCYPDRLDLCAEARAAVARYGGSAFPPSGSPRFHALRKLIGWRMSARVRRWAQDRT